MEGQESECFQYVLGGCRQMDEQRIKNILAKIEEWMMRTCDVV